MVAKTHTDDPFWKFRDQPQEKVAISACCWPRNPSDIAERLYRRRRTATLLFILLFSFCRTMIIEMFFSLIGHIKHHSRILQAIFSYSLWIIHDFETLCFYCTIKHRKWRQFKERSRHCQPYF